MTNRQLIDTLTSGRATDAQKREYRHRVGKLKEAHPCVHGHYECALVEKGPCVDEHWPQDEGDDA